MRILCVLLLIINTVISDIEVINNFDDDLLNDNGFICKCPGYYNVSINNDTTIYRGYGANNVGFINVGLIDVIYIRSNDNQTTIRVTSYYNPYNFSLYLTTNDSVLEKQPVEQNDNILKLNANSIKGTLVLTWYQTSPELIYPANKAIINEELLLTPTLTQSLLNSTVTRSKCMCLHITESGSNKIEVPYKTIYDADNYNRKYS